MKNGTALQDDSLGFWIYRIYAQASNHLRRTFQAHGYDCTPEQWGVLTRLRDEEGVNQSRLGARTFKDRHNIARILDLLEKRRLIERRSDADDRRAYRVFLTPEGKETEEKLRVLVMRHRTGMFDGLSATDVETMRRIFALIERNIEKRDDLLSQRIRGGSRNGG